MIKVETLLPSARGRLFTIMMEALLVDAAALLNHPDGDIVVVCDAADRMAGVVTKSDVVARIGSCTGHSCMMVHHYENAAAYCVRRLELVRPRPPGNYVTD